MRGYPQFSFWISITLVKIYISCIIVNRGKNTLKFVGTVLKVSSIQASFRRFRHTYIISSYIQIIISSYIISFRRLASMSSLIPFWRLVRHALLSVQADVHVEGSMLKSLRSLFRTSLYPRRGILMGLPPSSN